MLLRVDWDTYADGRPTGMSLYTYNEKGDGERLVTNDVDSVPLRRPDGRYRLMLFNLSTDEFGSMNFYRMDDVDSARVMLTTVTQRANRSWDKGVVYQRDPEQLYVALDTLVFPPELMATRATDTVRYVVVERPRPLVSRLVIRVRIENIRGMRSVEETSTASLPVAALPMVWVRTPPARICSTRGRRPSTRWGRRTGISRHPSPRSDCHREVDVRRRITC